MYRSPDERAISKLRPSVSFPGSFCFCLSSVLYIFFTYFQQEERMDQIEAGDHIIRTDRETDNGPKRSNQGTSGEKRSNQGIMGDEPYWGLEDWGCIFKRDVG
jgi:hypothetical protein